MPQSAPDFARYLHVRSAYGPSFSSQGDLLAFVTDISGVAEAWRVRVPDATDGPYWADQLTFGGERISRVCYAPNRDCLLVASDIGGSELTQLFLFHEDGATLERLTDAPNAIAQFATWFPDGQRVLYASNQRNPRFFEIWEHTVESGEGRFWRLPEGVNRALRYSPDGASVLAAHVETFFRDRLYLVDRATGKSRPITPEITAGHGSHPEAAWAADGQSLYVVTDEGCEFRRLALLDLPLGTMTYLTDESWDVESLAVSEDGKHLALVTNVAGYSRLDVFDVSAGWKSRRQLVAPDVGSCVVTELIWSRDGSKLAFTRESSTEPRDIWVYAPATGDLSRATRSATAGLSRAKFVEPQLVQYSTFDGRQIPTFLYTPPGVEARGLPAIVYVHGGPESQYRPTFNPIVQYFVACGYVVLAPNVRGSSGYGHAYMSLDDVRMRMDAIADLRYAARWLAETGIADSRRIAIMGSSYGGFMTLAALANYPDLWAAGVNIVGIANFITFLEQTSVWRRKLREAEYGSLEADRDFLIEMSPINKVDNITAPLFVVHGANDPRVPVGEAEQMVAALRARGVEVEYLRYDDEGHGLIKRANRLVAYPTIARFLDRILHPGE